MKNNKSNSLKFCNIVKTLFKLIEWLAVNSECVNNSSDQISFDPIQKRRSDKRVGQCNLHKQFLKPIQLSRSQIKYPARWPAHYFALDIICARTYPSCFTDWQTAKRRVRGSCVCRKVNISRARVILSANNLILRYTRPFKEQIRKIKYSGSGLRAAG